MVLFHSLTRRHMISSILISPETNIPEGIQYEKISTLYRCTGEVHAETTTAVAASK